ncbi:MAG: response regulator [Planctomycetes bacterium]|nr:response regulator [Planctomycetota bacterium]
MKNLKEYYSTSEVAEMVNLHRNTIILAIRNAKLPASKTPGGHSRIARKDLVEFAASRNLPINFELFPTVTNGDKVLVVDDDDLVISVITRALKGFGYRTAIASTGYEVGFAIRDFAPDVVLLDINLPDINGIEVCKKIRADESRSRIKIIAISASNDQAAIDAISEAGADDFMPKPISMEQMRERIVELVGPIREVIEGRS